jgi:hypothetical protein
MASAAQKLVQTPTIPTFIALFSELTVGSYSGKSMSPRAGLLKSHRATLAVV